MRTSQSVAFDKRHLYEVYGAPKPDGVTEKSLAIELPRNAVVKKYEVVITAATAHAVTAGDAGQVRTTPVFGGVTVVLDFGTPRTVSAIAAPEGVSIRSVSTWIGTEFASPPKYFDESGVNYLVLPSEVRTERLQVIVSPSATTDALATEMVLVLPESPAGIRTAHRRRGADLLPAVRRGARQLDRPLDAILEQREPAGRRPGPGAGALTGNPLDETLATFTATVTSRVPGTLDLTERPGGQEVLRIRRAAFNGQPSRDVAFESEGQQAVVLDSIPPDLTVNEVRLTVTGTPPAVRVVPPIGPEPPSPSFASFTLSPERAACIRVPQEPRLAALTGVRIALAGGSAGGEARVLLWKSKDTVDLTPAEPLENGASEPLTLDAGAEVWTTFSWKKPIPAPKDFVLWAVVTINRGDASLIRRRRRRHWRGAFSVGRRPARGTTPSALTSARPDPHDRAGKARRACYRLFGFNSAPPAWRRRDRQREGDRRGAERSRGAGRSSHAAVDEPRAGGRHRERHRRDLDKLNAQKKLWLTTPGHSSSTVEVTADHLQHLRSSARCDAGRARRSAWAGSPGAARDGGRRFGHRHAGRGVCAERHPSEHRHGREPANPERRRPVARHAQGDRAGSRVAARRRQADVDSADHVGGDRTGRRSRAWRRRAGLATTGGGTSRKVTQDPGIFAIAGNHAHSGKFVQDAAGRWHYDGPNVEGEQGPKGDKGDPVLKVRQVLRVRREPKATKAIRRRGCGGREGRQR